jgi:hypothetical protein
VRYGSRDPLGRVLASYSLDLSRDPTLADLLSQARREAVQLSAEELLEGTIVNVELVQLPEDEPKTYLTLSTADGLQRIALDEVRRIRFLHAELQEELDVALAALAQHRGSDENTLRLHFTGNGTRPPHRHA